MILITHIVKFIAFNPRQIDPRPSIALQGGFPQQAKKKQANKIKMSSSVTVFRNSEFEATNAVVFYCSFMLVVSVEHSFLELHIAVQ